MEDGRWPPNVVFCGSATRRFLGELPLPGPVTHSRPLIRPQRPSLLRIPSAASQAAEVPVEGRGNGGDASRRLTEGPTGSGGIIETKDKAAAFKNVP